MSQKAYFASPSRKQLNYAVSRNNETDYAYSIKFGVVLGFIAGWLIGVGQILYVNSAALSAWGGVVSIPLSSAVGWAMYGGIVGCTGILSRIGVRVAPERYRRERLLRVAGDQKESSRFGIGRPRSA